MTNALSKTKPAKKRGRGRPALPKDAVRITVLSVRLTAAERWAIERKATAAGLSASDWARGVIVAVLAEEPV